MINQSLLDPKSIVVVGGSNNTEKPGGKVLKNLIDGAFSGDLQVINHKESTVQGITCLSSVDELKTADLAILSIPSRFCPAVVHTLATEKETRAFIILSAGFSEEGEQGKAWEEEITATVNSVDGCLLGPNCIGVLNRNYQGVFTTPIPPLCPEGCDLISSSGATAVFLLEAGITLGLRFASVFSVGNGAQTGVEEVLEYMDLNYDPEKDSAIKLLYLESVSKPAKLLKHATSLIRKGVRIAAIKAGHTEAGNRAAASHTGAISNPDMVVRALLKKAGIVQCHSRQELLSVASLFSYKELRGKNIAVITHAGGPAVMLTDALSSGGLNVPVIDGPNAEQLLSRLNPGSSTANPIDFLATGTAEQLGTVIDYCENKFDHIDAMVVIFGSPGLFDVTDVYDLLKAKLETCSKPIYPVLPSVINAREGIQAFLSSGHPCFYDEVVLGKALSAIHATPIPQDIEQADYTIDHRAIRNIVDAAADGFLPPAEINGLLDATGIAHAPEHIITRVEEIDHLATTLVFPVAMKTVGPVHKTDVDGVVLNVASLQEIKQHFTRLIQIEHATAVLIQSMVSGTELFIGVKREDGFGHLVLCGLGGVFIEVLDDFSACLAPVSESEAQDMIRELKGYDLIRGTRGKEGVNAELFGEIIQRISLLTTVAPEIAEMDINPLMGSMAGIIAVDTRIRIEK